MAKLNRFSHCLDFLCIITLTLLAISPNCNAALFIFGDSAFDVGNNNYINTSFQATKFPYGETFFEYPTGRFSNGRLVPDFIAEYAKLPFIVPYLQPCNHHDFKYGVNFASAGAGALVETRPGLVIDLKTQLGNFKNVSKLLREKFGDAEAEDLLSRAVYLFSVGGNDYLFPFETNSSVLRTYSPEQFAGQVIGNISEVIQEIYKIGGRKFAFPSMWPLACFPFARVIKGGDYGCLDQITPYLKSHNKQLFNLLQNFQKHLNKFKYSLLDFYSFLEERMNHPSKQGFKEGKVACCGSGPYRGEFNCGGGNFSLCYNAIEYVFFDSVHPSEKVYEQFAKQAWSGKLSLKGSYSLMELFESNHDLE
ncbi:hypothetical protein CsatB_012452 [Cannabis sativa]